MTDETTEETVDYRGKDYIGRVQGFVRVVASAGRRDADGRLLWEMLCTRCGATFYRPGPYVNMKSVVSCGCYHRDELAARRTKHHESQACEITPEYRAWMALRNRCRNAEAKGDHIYAGKAVCSRWQEYAAFIADMGRRPPDKSSIDRIDGNIGYTCGRPDCVDCRANGWPANCRWATATEQAINRLTNLWIEWDGRRQPLSEWAKEYGFNYGTLYGRYRRGIRPPELFGPIDQSQSRRKSPK